ncbi:MAG: tetratricopeptide repeat protein, partial [Chloroflexi bacterium]|nr:tetratricopeptide repeat protein [Chloroflexota bacterium]
MKQKCPKVSPIDFIQPFAGFFKARGEWVMVFGFTKAYQLFNRLGESELDIELKHRYLAVNRNNIGVAYTSLGMNKEALDCFRGALKTAKQTGEARVVVWANDSFGDSYFRAGDFKKATAWHRKSLALNKKSKDTFGLAVSNNKIGCDYWLKNRYKESLSYHKKAHSLIEKSQIGGELEKSCIELSLGVDHLFLGKSKQAGSHFTAALQIARKLGNRENEINALAWLGIYFWKAEDAKLAEKHLAQAAKLAKETGLANIQARILFHTGAIWDLLGDNKKARQLFDRIPKLLKPSEIP